MTVNLIPQDELTLNLLAEVLAKMYQFSLKSKNDAPDEVAEPDMGTSSADLGNRHQGHIIAEQDLAQVVEA
jgi:hypothetical protein